MATASFSGKKVLSTFTSPHSMNAWGYIENFGWLKVQPLTADGVNNVFNIFVLAQASGRTVSGSYDNAAKQILTLYLN